MSTTTTSSFTPSSEKYAQTLVEGSYDSLLKQDRFIKCQAYVEAIFQLFSDVPSHEESLQALTLTHQYTNETKRRAIQLFSDILRFVPETTYDRILEEHSDEKRNAEYYRAITSEIFASISEEELDANDGLREKIKHAMCQQGSYRDNEITKLVETVLSIFQHKN